MAWQCVLLSALFPSETNYSVGNQLRETYTVEDVRHNEDDHYKCRVQRFLSGELTPTPSSEISFKSASSIQPILSSYEKVDREQRNEFELLLPWVGYAMARRFAGYFNGNYGADGFSKTYHVGTNGYPDDVRINVENPEALNLRGLYARWRITGMTEPVDNFFMGYVRDTDGDGSADSVWGETASRNSSINIGRRSAYTAGMLDFFNPIFNKKDFGRYTYHSELEGIYTEKAKGQFVHKGDVLFSINASKGPIEYAAETDGFVDYCTWAKFCMTVEK